MPAKDAHMPDTPLPAYNAGPDIDFGPLTNALDSVRQTNYQNALLGFQQRASDRADQELTGRMQQMADEHNAAITDRNHKIVSFASGWAQDILADPNPQSRAQRAQAYFSSHPELIPAMQKNGMDPNDPDGALKAIVAEARGYQNPLDVQAKQATINESNANVAKTNMETQALRRTQALIGSLDFGDGGNQGSGSYNALATGGGIPQQWPGGVHRLRLAAVADLYRR